MKNKIKTLLATAVLAAGFSAQATETIAIQNPYGPSHSATPATLKILQAANAAQTEFNFVLESRPGGNQAIAVKQMDASPTNRLAIIAPAFVENTTNGTLTRSNYVPVHALGDACWAVISNRGNEAGGIASLRGESEIIVGGVGIGNSAHLTALLAAEKFGFKVKYVVFRSNNDALVNMTGNNGVNFVIDRIDSYEAFKTQNSKLHVLAASCPKRLPGMPAVRTLREQGIDAPYIFNITVANVSMPADKRERIGKVLNSATQQVGAAEIDKLSGMNPPVFDRVSADRFYASSIAAAETLLVKFSNTIEDARKGK